MWLWRQRTTSRPYRRWGRGKGERGRETGSSPSGKEYVIAEVKFAFQSPRSFRLLITWPPGLLQREERERKKRFFPLNFNIYIYLDNRTSKVFLLISKKSVLLVQSCCCCFFLLISKKKDVLHVQSCFFANKIYCCCFLPFSLSSPCL